MDRTLGYLFFLGFVAFGLVYAYSTFTTLGAKNALSAQSELSQIQGAEKYAASSIDTTGFTTNALIGA